MDFAPSDTTTDDGDSTVMPDSVEVADETSDGKPSDATDGNDIASSVDQTIYATAPTMGTRETIKAESGDWQIALENFLTGFPTMLDETALYEVGMGIRKAVDSDGIYAPVEYMFQDLDGDGIPEVLINFIHPESEPVFHKVYKLYGDTYEQIAQARFVFYTNQQGRLVAATIRGYTVNAIYFAEIQGKELVLSDFIDSEGNDSYNGVKYDSFSEWDGTSLFYATDADKTLRLLPEIDCSDIVALSAYRLFLEGNICALYDEKVPMYIDDIVLESDGLDYPQYAFFDMNGDAIPELHLRLTLGATYSIFTYANGQVELWHMETGYCSPLNNRAIRYERPGGGPPHTNYQYIVLDFWGNEVYRIAFFKYNPFVSENVEYPAIYNFNGADVDEETWESLAGQYLSIGSDLIEWRPLRVDFPKKP